MSDPAETCPWWRRWWHSRKRTIDMATLIQAIVDRADTPGQAWRGIRLFWEQQGQEHWWCPCAEPYREAYRSAFETISQEEWMGEEGGPDGAA
jgi:hypothetical protein